jgi:N-acetylmuramoyl-L-alanine amidase/Bacterial SH3 domain
MATWRGRETALKCSSIEEFTAYMRSLDYSRWRPSGIVQHNTARPSLNDWIHGGTPPMQRMENMKSYYQRLGWSAGPHCFVDNLAIYVMTDLNVRGVHSPSYNATRLGIEMVGDFAVEDDETGPGKKVLELTTALFGECCMFFGWEPNNDKIKQHKEDPQTNHDCPGDKVVKSEFLADVAQYMGEGGDHEPDPPRPLPYPAQGVVHGVASGDKLNIRAMSSSSAPIIGTAENGDELTVVGEAMNGSTKWLRLQVGKSAGTDVALFGWCSAQYVRVEG